MWFTYIFKLVFFTLIVTVTVPVSAQDTLCDSCTCVDSHIFCVGAIDLSLLVTYDGSKVTTLIIVDVQQGVLQGDNFMKFPNVLDLQMDSNNFDIDPDVFSSLRKLINLELRNNSIEEIPEAMFRENSNIKNLDLSMNRIKEINNGVFSHLGRLITLNLTSNRISMIESEAFAGLEDLRVLDLSDNQVGRVGADVLSPLPALAHLSLRANRLERLEAWALAALEELDVRGNALLRVDAAALEPLRRLRVLRAGGNRVAALAPALVALLAARPWLRAQLAPNPLRCACDATELRAAWAEATARGLCLDCTCDSGLPWGDALRALRCHDGEAPTPPDLLPTQTTKAPGAPSEPLPITAPQTSIRREEEKIVPGLAEPSGDWLIRSEKVSIEFIVLLCLIALLALITTCVVITLLVVHIRVKNAAEEYEKLKSTTSAYGTARETNAMKAKEEKYSEP